MVTAGSELIPGVSIDRRYRIQCTLGRGGFGRTYLAADDCRFGELCVLKEFVPNSEADPVVAQKLRDLFHREALVLHQLDHPQIPKFLAVVEEDDRLFIAQEYIDGKTYWQLLQERQPHGRAFSQREIIPWLRELLRVLEYLHQKNIVHRDISPDNIMLPRGRTSPVLIDFGVVKQVIPHLHLVQSGDSPDLVQASVSVGKFGYAPYEQIRMGQCSPRSDLYALAVTAVVLLTGKPPNLLMDEKSLEWQWQQCVRLDTRLRKILEVMLAEKPQDRFPSATVVLEQLQDINEASLAVDLQPRPTRNASGQRPSSQPALSNPSSAGTLMEQPVVAAMTTLAHPISAFTNQLQETRWLTPSVVVPEGLEPHTITACTDIESAIGPKAPSQLVWIPKPPAPRFSLQSLLSLVRVAVLRLPQDQQGNSRQLSLKQIFSLSFLLLLPLSGVAIGIRSPHMASVCWVVGNCADAKEQDQRYYQAIELAESAKTLSAQANNLNDLQQARDRLADSIAQLNAFSGQLKLSAIGILPEYQTLLQTLNQSLEKETRAAQLLSRAEAEAQKAIEQSQVAKTIQQYQEAQLQWKRVMATLVAIPKGSLVDRQVSARSQEYQTRLDAISVKMAAASPQSTVTSTRSAPTQRTTPQPQIVAQRPPAQTATAPRSAPSSTVTQAAVQPARSRSSQPATQAKPVAQRPARRSTSTPTAQTRRSSHIAQVPPPGNSPQAPSTSPLEIARRWIAGSVVTSATQTLDNVDIWIEGSRTEEDGTFTANLMIRNRSGRGFGFVPVYAESQDAQGNIIRSRVLLTGPSDALLEPGELLSGKISLLDRPANARRLTLVIQESTSGDRLFRVPL